MLNSGSTKLDHILTMGQSSKHGLGYTETKNTITTTPKTVFVKADVTDNVATTFKIVYSSGKNSTLSLSEGKRRFIPTSQVYDQNLLVKFTKNICKVFNDS